ncbi:MAG: alkaline phosphatase family protein [Terriglobales bacterium]
MVSPRFHYLLSALLLSVTPIATSQVAVTTYRYDLGRTGQNLNEAVLTPSNVNANSFGALFTYSLPADSYVYAQPLYLPNVNIPGMGLRNVLYLATEHDIVYAFDADGTTSTPYWTADLALRVGGSPVRTSGTTHDDYLGPQLGVTSTPVIDQSTGTIYVVANTMEGGNRVQRLHALDVTTGAEKFGGSVVIQGSASSATFDPSIQNQRPALLLANGNVYIGWGAYGDNGPYHGWVMAYNAATLEQIAVYCTTPTGSAGSNWMLGALTADADGSVYTVTGNGTVGTGNHGESVIKLTSTLALVNGFTPTNYDALNANDLDLGGGGLLQLPDQPGAAPHLAVLAGKEGSLYVLDRDNLGQFDTASDHAVQDIPNAFTNCNVDGECNFQTPAYWQNKVYLIAANHPLQVYQLTNGTLSTSPVFLGPTTFVAPRGASPMISANGSSNGIVWALRVDDQSSAAPPAILYAYDATNANELYNSTQNQSRDGLGQAQFFIVPVIANGRVYVATRNQVTAYGLLASKTAQAPTIQLGVNPASGGAPLTVTASTSGSSDPNSGGNIASSWIDFGDGTVVNATTATHTYNNPGHYTVLATVYDNLGRSSGTSKVVNVANGPAVLGVSPPSGNGSGGVFSFQYSDGAGASALNEAEQIFNTVAGYQNGCSTIYFASSNSFYLINDATHMLGPLTPGSSGTLQNSQCTLNGSQSTVSISGTTLTVNVSLTFSPTFAGAKNIYSWANDKARSDSGVQTVGTWTVPTSATPIVLGVSPSSGNGSGGVFSFQYSDGAGASALNEAEQIFNTVAGYQNGCSTIYFASSNSFYLINDATHMLGPLTPGSSGTLQNSQCTLNGSQSTVSISGTTLTVNVSLTFSASFAGNKNIYSWANDNTGSDSGVQTVGTWTVPTTATSVAHVLFMLQENHSFDNYFGRMGQYRASKGFTDSFDGVPLNVRLTDANGKAVSPYHLATVCTEDLAPGWDPIHLDIDGGKMDKFPVETQNFLASSIDSGGRRSMGYYDWNDLPYYYELGFQYATSDRYFSSAQTRTIPNRMYLFAATSFGHIGNDSPPGGGWSKATIFDRLDAAGVSWRIYRVDETNSLADWATYSRDRNKVFPISQYFTDIKSDSTTPQVVFIDRGGGSSGLDEHPGTDIQNGAHETASIVNALLASPTYKSSAFFLSWDEPGGFYDHVAPVAMTAPDNFAPMLASGDQPGDFAHSGLRVPVMVISPWVKPHFVSHVARDHTSILKFIETRFNLPPLTARDSNADNMMEFFDFSAPQIAAPPALPAQPTSGNCDQSLEAS